jgi:sugar lactone lactonase YvrE
MKNKLILWLSVILLIVLIAFMAKDLFTSNERTQQNVYEYDLNSLREVDESQISHKEIKQIKMDADEAHAIAVDANDNIYVGTDKNVLVFNSEGKQINSLKLRETAYCLTVMENGNMVVGMKKRIDIRKPDGSLRNSFVVKGERTYITSVAVQDNNLFVADAGQKIIHHYNIDGNKIKEIGKANQAEGIKGFVIPSPYFDLLIGRQGELWAVNPGRHAFEAYNFKGEQISNWNRTSMSIEGFSGCCNPSNIAMLSDGSFVTAEKGLERVKIHLPSGDFKSVVAAPELFEAGTIGIDLAVDSNDRILVLDPTKRLIRIFERK